MSIEVKFTAYGAEALETLRAIVGEAKRDDPMAPVTIVVPNNIAGILARRHLAANGAADQSGVAAIYISTLARLAEQLATVHLTPRRPTTAAIRASAWRKALNADAGAFGAVKDHPATIRALVNAHLELRDLTDAGLDQVASRSSLAKEVVRLHRQVVAHLCSDWYDTTDLLRMAVPHAAAKQAELGEVVLYLPQRLGLAEADLVQALAQHQRLTVIAGITNVVRADRGVLATLTRLGLPSPDPKGDRPTAGRVLHASDSDDEVRSVVREVLSTLQDTPAHRVAVLYTDAVPYARLIHEQIAATGLTVNGPGVRPVHERALSRGFLGVLALADSDLHRADVFDALAEAPIRQFSGDRVPVTRWERLSRSAGVVEDVDWVRRLNTFITQTTASARSEEDRVDPSQGRIDGLQRKIHDAGALRDFVVALQSRLQAGRTITTWSGLGTWAIDLFHDLYGAADDLGNLPAEELYAATVIESSLGSLANLDPLEPVASLMRLHEILSLDVESALPRVGKYGVGVFVGPVSSAIGLSVDRAYVVGIAEDLYPGRLHQDALLPEQVRVDSELADTRESLDRKQRHLLAAFACAPEVVASFPRGDLRRSTQRLPSQFLLGTLRELTGDTKLPASNWESAVCAQITGTDSYAAGLSHAQLPATEQEWRTRAYAAGLEVADVVVAAAAKMRQARDSDDFTPYDGNLAGAEGLPDYATSLRPVAPTTLESYAECPHAYFMKRMLRIEPLDAPEAIVSISPLDLGNLIHESIDEFIRGQAGDLPTYGAPWSAAQRQALIEAGMQKADEFEAKGLTGHAVLWDEQRTVLRADLIRILAEDDAFRATERARVIRSELAFGEGSNPPVAIDVAGGRVLMRGSADLVHETEDGRLIVTDVKTGGSGRYSELKKDPIVAGTRLQLPVYAHAARSILGGDEVQAAYWFVRSKTMGNDRIPVVLNDALEVRYAEAIGTLTASIARGAFPAKAPDAPDFSWILCNYCNPDGVGHEEARERWERKRHDPALSELVGLIDPDAVSEEEST